jgi:hypothetical protein
MRRSATVLLLAVHFASTGCAANRKEALVPRAATSLDGGESYAAELLARVARLERDLDKEARARLSERTEATATLAKSKKEMAARLETMSEELRKREVALNRSDDSVKELREGAEQCSGGLEIQRKKLAALETQGKGAAAKLAESIVKLSAAEAAVKASEAEALRRHESATLESQRAKDLEGRLAESTQKAAALENEISALRDARQRPTVTSKSEANPSAREAHRPEAVASNESAGDGRSGHVSEDVPDQPSKSGKHSPDQPLAQDLAKARAEIVRLNALNLEQQALLDDQYGLAAPEGGLRSGTTTVKKDRRSSANRARTAAPIAPLSNRDRPAPSRTDSPNDLTAALARRDQIQHEIGRLEGSPADASAPGKAAELALDLDSVNREIRRLAVLLNVEDSKR